jgi:hypothetical protein
MRVRARTSEERTFEDLMKSHYTHLPEPLALPSFSFFDAIFFSYRYEKTFKDFMKSHSNTPKDALEKTVQAPQGTKSSLA